MSTNDKRINGESDQKSTSSFTVQVNLNEVLQQNVILQQLENEIEEYRCQNGGQESIQRYS